MNGTHYCDITGETDWVRKMIDQYDSVARASGSRIVHFCGHDCVPWDLAGEDLSPDSLPLLHACPMLAIGREEV